MAQIRDGGAYGEAVRTARRTIDGLGQGRELPSDTAWLTTLSVIGGMVPEPSTRAIRREAERVAEARGNIDPAVARSTVTREITADCADAAMAIWETVSQWRTANGQSAWTGGVAGDDEREELGREVSDYELEGEEDDQPDEMTVDSVEGGPANAADGEPPDGVDGSGDESDGQDGSGGGGGRGPARRPGGQDAADSGGQSATDSEDLVGGGIAPPLALVRTTTTRPAGLGTLRAEATTRTPTQTKGGVEAGGASCRDRGLAQSPETRRPGIPKRRRARRIS